ncbi:hypothetical protein OCGS_1226 [Oceaniovalibus guishaninsula JLT2003]|uniref:DUF2065 domain-containing protein n=1 Tax=Oceaniovalibus guishaninsula JLT2003 TaxID=1231392 RepID=K2HA18_9RHOB|nr:DUF2065 family protein [Oceaniovalibus guishaninsula]EKE44388.1 hypothetical protein OCGS_1226 [Oceaniovalibus guishaninsula JLT2003]
MATLVLALGMVLVAEGLVLALAPSRVEDLLDLLRTIPVEARRLMGLAALAIGAALVAAARLI